MVSLDPPEKNREFAESLNAAQVLLSDTSGAVAKDYGVSGFAGLYSKRWTFYIDKQGKIRHIDKAVDVKQAGADVAARLEVLGIPKRAAEPAAESAPSAP